MTGSETAGSETAALDVPLRYEVPTHDPASPSQRIHTPMVRASVNGVSTLLIIDSGASDHVFTRALAEAAGLTLVSTAPGTDHAGAEVRSFVAEQAVALRIDQAQVVVENAIVIEGPPPFEGWGIGGFLSPQQIDPRALMLLDLDAQRLKLASPTAEAWDALRGEVSGRHADRAERSVKRVMGEGDARRLVIVEGLLGEALRPVRVMLNSGGRHPEVSGGIVAAQDGSEVRATGKGLSGAAVEGRDAGDDLLLLGGGRLPLRGMIIREQGDAFELQLGIEPLTGVVFAVHPDPAVPVSLWLPAAAAD